MVPHRKQVLVLESERLLPAGILSLLTSRSEFDVTSLPVNGFFSLEKANQCDPDVIIIDEDLVASNITEVMQLLDHHPKLRLIVLGLGDNKLHIFDKHIVHVKDVSDFIAQI